MAIGKTKDGRYFVYWRVKGKLKKKYFGRGAEAEAAAAEYDKSRTYATRRPRAASYGPAFYELAMDYLKAKNFNENSLKLLDIRLGKSILPHFARLPGIKIKDRDLDNYVKKRRAAGVADSSIHRELTDVIAILNWAAKRNPPLIGFNPVSGYEKPAENSALVTVATKKKF